MAGRTMHSKTAYLWFALLLVIALQFAFWTHSRDMQARWLNVPPVPTQDTIVSSFLGDAQLAYRVSSIMLQNLGDEGGRVTPFEEYNYKDLGKWFALMDKLDPQSNYVPYIAAYYYGSLEGEPEKIRYVIDYLRRVGNSPVGEKWRWMVRAVFLARYKAKDLDYALEIARDLAALANHPDADMPNWTRQMPAFILNAQGEQQAAYDLMIEVLKSVGDKIDPAEVNQSVFYICSAILSEEEAAENPLCKDVK